MSMIFVVVPVVMSYPLLVAAAAAVASLAGLKMMEAKTLSRGRKVGTMGLSRWLLLFWDGSQSLSMRGSVVR